MVRERSSINPRPPGLCQIYPLHALCLLPMFTYVSLFSIDYKISTNHLRMKSCVVLNASTPLKIERFLNKELSKNGCR